MSKWTEEEREALMQTAHVPGLQGFRRFQMIVPESDKNFDAWEVKRRRIDIPIETVGLSARQHISGIPTDYVGFSMGFFDIETTFSTQPIVLYAAIADQFGNVLQFKKGDDITDDSELVREYAEALNGYDILLGWNSKMFDIPVLNGRLAFHGLPPVNVQRHIDLMWYASGGSMRIGRRSLQSVSEYFDVPNRKTPLSVRLWDKAMSGDEEAYAKIIEHCDADVLVTRDVFSVLKPHIKNIHR